MNVEYLVYFDGKKNVNRRLPKGTTVTEARQKAYNIIKKGLVHAPREAYSYTGVALINGDPEGYDWKRVGFAVDEGRVITYYDENKNGWYLLNANGSIKKGY